MTVTILVYLNKTINISDIDYYSILETAYYLSNYESDKDKSYGLTPRIIT